MTEKEFEDFVNRRTTQSYMNRMKRSMRNDIVERAYQDGLLRAWQHISKEDTEIESDQHLLRLIAKSFRWAYIDRLRLLQTKPQQFRLGLLSLDVPSKWGEYDDQYELVPGDPSVEDELCEEMLSPEVETALSVLDQKNRYIAYEVWVRGRTQVDVAEEFGVTNKAINFRLSKSRQKLKEALNA